MGRSKHSTKSAHEHSRDPRQTLAQLIERASFYGEVRDDFIRAAVSIFKADKGGRDLKEALAGPFRDVVKHMEALESVLGAFQQSAQSQRFTNLLKSLRPFLQSPIIPLTLRRYDLPTLWADLPRLLKTFRGLTGDTRDFLEELPLADVKRVRNRALAWLYVVVRQYASSDGEVNAVLASVIYPEDQDLAVSGERKIYDHIRWFRKHHRDEYRQIEQYLEDRPCPTGNELMLFAFCGAPETDNSQ